MRNLGISTSLLVCILILSSCDRLKREKELEAIVIEYEVGYLDKTAGNISTSFLPKKMKLVLADHYAMNSIRGFFGQFSLIYIANLKKQQVTTLLKFLDTKQYYIGKKGELPIGIDPMAGMVLENTGNAEFLLDFECREYRLTAPGGIDVLVYASDEISFSSPNRTTPYAEIESVLLQFYTQLDVLKMFLKAEEYREEIISSKIFEVPDGYKEVSRETMEKTISSLFN